MNIFFLLSLILLLTLFNLNLESELYNLDDILKKTIKNQAVENY